MLNDRVQIIDRKKISDSRGWFLKIITGHEAELPPYTGEIYAISALPGETRANHYHLVANEWFTLIEGCAMLTLEAIDSNDRQMIELKSENPVTVYVPVNIAHSFKNLSDTDPFILLTYTDKLYDPNDTVAYSFQEEQ